LTRNSSGGKKYRQIFSTWIAIVSLPDFQEKWTAAIRALKHLIPDAHAKRLLANKKLAQIVADSIDESSLPQLQTLSWLRSLLLRLSRCSEIEGLPILDTGRNPTYWELRIRLKPNVPLSDKAVQVAEGIREMCKLLNLKAIPENDCGCEDSQFEFQTEGVIGGQGVAISFGIKEEPGSGETI